MKMRSKEKIFQRVAKFIRDEIRWLTPGLGVKRWLVLILAGTTLLGIGFAVLVLDVYRTAPDTWWLPILSFLSLRFLDRTLRAVIFGGLGILLIVVGIWGLNRSLLKPFIRSGKDIVDTLTQHRRRERGPRIVTIGGGTGLASLLRGLKSYSTNLTAIVTVADDGGSSGELRNRMGVLPPGDLRNCLAALSNNEALMSQIFQYRFADSTGLNGHNLGNLLITALADITGSFEEAIAESGRVLAVQGQVLPSTLRDVRLSAEISKDATKPSIKVKGESQIPQTTGKIERVWLEPSNVLAFPPAIQAILSADLVIVGPGSLYTSIMPNLLVPDIAEAIRASKAMKFYICNVATQPGETDGYSCADHLRAIEKHVNGRIFDLVICNNQFDGHLPANSDWVKPDPDIEKQYAIYCTSLVDKSNTWRHASDKLAQVVLDLYQERTGPLVGKDESK